MVALQEVFMSKANGIGCKRGTSANAGRKMVNIEATFIPGGKPYRKRVFMGQRWMTLVEDEDGNVGVDAHKTQEQAERFLLFFDADKWPVQLVAEATVAA